MHEASKDISREEVNNIVRPEEHKRHPDITNDAGGIYCPFTPLHGDVLIGKDCWRADMAREVKVVSIEIGHCKWMYSWVTPKESFWSSHQEDCLNHVSRGIKNNKGSTESKRATPHKIVKKIAQEQKVHAHWSLNYQKVLPTSIFDEKSVNSICPDKSLISQTFIIFQCLNLLILSYAENQ